MSSVRGRGPPERRSQELPRFGETSGPSASIPQRNGNRRRAREGPLVVRCPPRTPPPLPPFRPGLDLVFGLCAPCSGNGGGVPSNENRISRGTWRPARFGSIPQTLGEGRRGRREKRGPSSRCCRKVGARSGNTAPAATAPLPTRPPPPRSAGSRAVRRLLTSIYVL